MVADKTLFDVHDTPILIVYPIFRNLFTATPWPSGLRRNVKAVVLIGVGSNPTDYKFWVGVPHPLLPNQLISLEDR